MNPSTPLAPRLEPVLRRLRQRIRRVVAARGAAITVVTALAGLLAIGLLDLAFSPLPAVVRWLCPLVWLGAVVAVGVVWWWRPLRKPLELIRIARWLEIHHPELDERISTVLEVSGQADSGISAELIDALARESSHSLDGINPQVEVSSLRARRWLWPAAALVLVWALLFAVWPEFTARHVVRALLPTSTLGNAAGSITVTPGSVELIEGDPLQITASHSAGSRQPLEVVLHLADGSSSVMPMEVRNAGSVYQLGRADRTFEYEVRSGRQTSDRFKVTVWPQPRLSDPRVRLEFPAYTGWAARDHALGDNVAAIVGTRIELRSKLNTTLEAVRLEIDGQPAGTTTVERAADGGLMTSRWTLENPGHSAAGVLLKHRLGREFEGARFTIESRADKAPEVKWLGTIPPELRLRPDDLLELDYAATDDVGLGVVQLEVQPESGDSARLPLEVPPRVARTETPVWRGHLKQPLGSLASRWPKTRVFKLRIRLEDSRPVALGGPGVGTSEWVVIRLDAGAQSLARQEIAAAQSDARESIEQARQQVQQAREKIERRRQDLQSDKLPEESRKELSQARDQLAKANEVLAQLAGRMDDTVKAAMVPELNKAAATVEAARQKLENAPLQDTPPQRGQSAAAAIDEARKAERQLEKMRDELQRSEPQLQDYAKLKELEQQQRELARQAEQANAQTPPTEPWKQQQDRVAEALRQDIQQQPDAQAAVLEQQAKQATQLAAQAREQAAQQEALKQSAQPQANAAKDAAQETAELATEVRDTPQVAASEPMKQAAQATDQAAKQADQAAKDESQGKPAEATTGHAQAARQLAQAAAKLDQAAAEFTRQAAAAVANKAGEQQAPTPGQPLAEAFQQAAKAADATSQESAASHSQAAADALSQAAAGTLSAMQGHKPSRSPSQQPGTEPGKDPGDSPLRLPGADPGVPPELAKLGISAADWEKIKSSLKSEAGGSSSIAMPEEYRDLVRRYFQEISKDSPR